jgi:hypothetical protein
MGCVMASKTYAPNPYYYGIARQVFNYQEIGCGGPEWMSSIMYAPSNGIYASLSGVGPWDGVGDNYGDMYRSLVEFDLSSNPLPTGATVTDITLHIHVTSTSESRDCYVYDLNTNKPSTYGIRGKLYTAIIGTVYDEFWNPVLGKGSGYVVDDEFGIFGGQSWGATVRVTEVDEVGGIVDFDVVDQGAMYIGYLYRADYKPEGGDKAWFTPATVEGYNAGSQWTDIGAGSLLYTFPYDETPAAAYSVSLDSAAITQLETHPEWFAVGFKLDESAYTGSHYVNFYSAELIITYTGGTRRRVVVT